MIPVQPGDLLAPDALYSVASEIRFHPAASLVFTDDDCLDERGRREKPCFKTGWSPELALSTNLVVGLAAFRRSRPVSAGPDRSAHGRDRSLATSSSPPARGRRDPSRAGDPLSPQVPDDAGSGRRRRLCCSVNIWTSSEFRVPTSRWPTSVAARVSRLRWRPSGDRLVSIVIVSRTPALAARCLDSLFQYSENVRFEVLVITSGGDPESWRSLGKRLSGLPVQFMRFEPEGGVFNFQKACTPAARGLVAIRFSS